VNPILKNTFKYILFIFLATGLTGPFIYPQTPTGPSTPGIHSYSLDELLLLAKEKNLLLETYELDKKIAEEEYKESRILPNIDIEYARGKGEINEIPGETEKPSPWEFSAKWTLPNPIHRAFFLASLRNKVNESIIESDIKKNKILENLKIRFFKLQMAVKIEKSWNQRLKNLEELHSIAKKKADIGEIKEIDALRASVEIQKCKTEIFKIQKTISYHQTKLNEILNFSIPTDFTIIENFSASPLPPIENNLPELVKASLSIRLKQANFKKYTQALYAARTSFIEGIDLFVSREKELDGKTWKVGLGISIPLFDGKSHSIKKAKLESDKAHIESNHSNTHFLADIQQIVAETRILEKEIETYEGAILKEGKENMELSEQLYKSGEIPLMIFLDSQNSFFEIEERFYQAITEFNILKTKLETLLGVNL